MTNTYKLLTPGPLTTTDTVKQEMMVDRCTWDDDYKAVTQKIRRQLLELAQVSEDDYTAVLMQGSGTFGVESVFSSVIGDQDKVLICSQWCIRRKNDSDLRSCQDSLSSLCTDL